QYPDCRVIAFDWGPWEVGMVTPELKRMFTERDIQLIPVKSGVDFLASQLLSTRPTPAQLIVGAPPLRPAVSLHPDLKSYQIHRRLSAQDNPFLLDHTIGENPVLPATCAAAWMINSCEQLYPGYTFFSINQFRVLKGLVFDANLPDEFVLEVKETSKADHDQVSLDAVIWSKNSRDRTFYHYTSQIDLRREIPPAPQVEPIQASPMAQATPGASLYQDGTLFHGPAFQGVQQVERIDPDGLSMRCSLAQVPVSRQGQFPVATSNPYIYDAIVQCLLIWTQHFSQAPCLPSSLQSMQQYLPLSFDRPYQVEMKIRSASENSAVADIDVLDPQGRLHVHIQGLEGTISRHLAQVIAQRPEKDHLVKPGKPSI
ncbi:MAG: polyketide synthase dehydratase domain-containing protein, partial [Anaerolineaceae bacterium]|nr:polyketide synthase dehydratase domain-containing protein [Anaerolineaceae bacterium]